MAACGGASYMRQSSGLGKPAGARPAPWRLAPEGRCRYMAGSSRQAPDQAKNPMPATRDDLFRRLDELGIKTRTAEHEAVFTVAESTGLERELPGGHTKNLFLKDAKGRLFLVIAESHTAVDLKTLHKMLGCARLTFCKPDLLMEVLAIPAG